MSRKIINDIVQSVRNDSIFSLDNISKFSYDSYATRLWNDLWESLTATDKWSLEKNFLNDVLKGKYIDIYFEGFNGYTNLYIKKVQ